MKQFSFLFFILLSISILVSSWDKKDTTTSIEGKVLEEGTNKPLPNKRVIIYVDNTEFLGPTNISAIDTVFSDAAGNYRWMTEDETIQTYEARVKNDTYYREIIPVSFDSQKQTKEDIILSPKAWVRYHIKNVNPFNNNDRILVGYIYDPFVGANIDLSILDKEAYTGNKNNLISWFVTKNYVIKSFQDSVFIKGLDTIDYYINY